MLEQEPIQPKDKQVSQQQSQEEVAAESLRAAEDLAAFEREHPDERFKELGVEYQKFRKERRDIREKVEKIKKLIQLGVHEIADENREERFAGGNLKEDALRKLAKQLKEEDIRAPRMKDLRKWYLAILEDKEIEAPPDSKKEGGARQRVFETHNEKFTLERLTNPEDPRVEAVQQLLEAEFSQEEVDPIKVMKEAMTGRMATGEECAPYLVFTAENAKGEVVGAATGAVVGLVNTEGEESSTRGVFLDAYILTAPEARGKGIGEELFRLRNEGAKQNAQERGIEILGYIGEAVEGSETFFNRQGARHLYVEQDDGAFTEVPYQQPPLDWDTKTGKPAEGTGIGLEHLMIKLSSGAYRMSGEELMEMVRGMYYYNNYREKEYFDNAEAYSTHTKFVEQIQETLEQFVEGKTIVLLSAQERKAMQAEGINFVEHQTGQEPQQPKGGTVRTEAPSVEKIGGTETRPETARPEKELLEEFSLHQGIAREMGAVVEKGQRAKEKLRLSKTEIDEYFPVIAVEIIRSYPSELKEIMRLLDLDSKYLLDAFQQTIELLASKNLPEEIKSRIFEKQGIRGFEAFYRKITDKNGKLKTGEVLQMLRGNMADIVKTKETALFGHLASVWQNQQELSKEYMLLRKFQLRQGEINQILGDVLSEREREPLKTQERGAYEAAERLSKELPEDIRNKKPGDFFGSIRRGGLQLKRTLRGRLR